MNLKEVFVVVQFFKLFAWVPFTFLIAFKPCSASNLELDSQATSCSFACKVARRGSKSALVGFRHAESLSPPRY